MAWRFGKRVRAIAGDAGEVAAYSAAVRSGDDVEAERLARSLLERDPTIHVLWFDLALAAKRRRDWAEAVGSGRGAAEIVAVATLSSYRGRGLAASLSTSLARSTLAEGNGLVFLSAADDRVAAIYTRIGFKQVGTACIAELN